MLLDVLTLLGVLYVVLAILQYLSSLFKSPSVKNKPSSHKQCTESVTEEGQEETTEVCQSCGQSKLQIPHIIMPSEIIQNQQQQSDSNLDQYRSEILKRRKRIEAGEVKGFYLANNTSSTGTNDLEGGLDARRGPSYSGDYSTEDDITRHRSLTREVRSYDDPSIQPAVAVVNTSMVGLSKNVEHGYYGDPLQHWTNVKQQQKNISQSNRQLHFQQQQQSSLDDRRLSVDTVPVKMTAPVTVINSVSVGSGSPFKVSENSAFTPIKPKGDTSVERRPGLLSSGGNTGPAHAQSFPDVSVDSGVNTAASNASSSSAVSTTQGPIQITVVMKPTSGSTEQQLPLSWTSSIIPTNRSEGNLTSTDFNRRTVIQVPGPAGPDTKMVQTMSNVLPVPHNEERNRKYSEPGSPIKLTMGGNEDTFSRKPYSRTSTTTMASTAALARAQARNNYYSGANVENVPVHLRQLTPPPPPTAELLTPQLLKKQSAFGGQGRLFYSDQPQMALTRAMKKTGTAGQPAKVYFGNLNDTAVPQPYHPPTMANYETQPAPLSAGPRIGASEATLFAFCGSSTGQSSTFDTVGRQPRQQQRTRFSPSIVQHQCNDETEQMVVWRANGTQHQHSLSVDETFGHERSRSRERSRIRRQPEPVDETGVITREITDQGVPANEDVLKGGNVTSKLKLFEALAEQEFHELDSQFGSDHRRSRRALDRWPTVAPAEPTVGASPGQKAKKMERSHTVHTVRTLMAPDAYQYENAPYSQKNPYAPFVDDQENRFGPDHHQEPASPRFNPQTQQLTSLYPYENQKMHELMPPSQMTRDEEAVEFPPASVSPRAVIKEQATIGKLHQFQQAQVVQQPRQTQLHHPAPQPQVQAQAQVLPKYQHLPQQVQVDHQHQLHAPQPQPQAPVLPKYQNQPQQMQVDHEQQQQQILPKHQHQSQPQPQPQRIQVDQQQPHVPLQSAPKQEQQRQQPARSPPVQIQLQPASPAPQPAPVEPTPAVIVAEKIKPHPVPVPAVTVAEKTKPQPVPEPMPVPVSAATTSTGTTQSDDMEEAGDAGKLESETSFEDEMSKMSIAQKAKLFEQKAEEQAQQKKRFNSIRHKTQPVTTEEVQKARSVVKKQMAQSTDGQKMVKSGQKEAESEEEEEEDWKETDKKNKMKASQNVIIYQQHAATSISITSPDKLKSQSRPSDGSTSNKQQPTVKPRKVVYLHSNETTDSSNKQESQNGDISAHKNGQFNGGLSSDQNNNEKLEEKGQAASLVNGCEKPTVFPRNTRIPKFANAAAVFKAFENAENGEHNSSTVPVSTKSFVRSSGVKEKAKMLELMNDLHTIRNVGNISNGALVNGHHGQFCSRILVNADDDEETSNMKNNFVNGHNRPYSSDLDSFCSSVQDLEWIGTGVAKVEDDSFLAIVRAPVIRLHHFSRPKPKRRHSSHGNRKTNGMWKPVVVASE